MLTVHHLHKVYGLQTVLHDISFSINNSDRVGLIGSVAAAKAQLPASPTRAVWLKR
ncbi:MAG: hypothetical protein HF973_04510 [Chloroflexi bacterium]|nr:hypothetical protein [Chloroflexota bacterium]